ncbi:multidrug effflux MFS transporter [Rhodoligotrophos ferricapiens]|uniref:multidrug effflux MFS transporter n=1 Tax=Rhodoligotrophos ferricapiens TaxID=3069264 RepID=UPI00315CE4B0
MIDQVANRSRLDARPSPFPSAPLWLVALVTLTGTLAMHIFVPALPSAGLELAASKSAMQMTVSLYIVGLAAGQLIYGPLSDRFGRRRVLMAGLGLYAIASLAAALASSADALIVSRLFQALGGCSGLVLGRAIIRDTGGTMDAARRLALMNLIVMVGPGLAPVVGGALATMIGWRSIFYTLCALGLLTLVLAAWLLPETSQPSKREGQSLTRNYGQLLGSRAFIGYAIGGGCATTSAYAFIASAPFIFVNQLGRPDHEIGAYLALLIFGVWLGNILTSRLISKVALDRLMITGNLVSVVAAITFLAIVLSGHLSVGGAVGCVFLFTVGAGVASPLALTKAVSVNPHVIGSASGLYGFSQMAIGAICTAVAGLGDNPALTTALVLAAAGVIGQSSFWIALRNHQPKAAA